MEKLDICDITGKKLNKIIDRENLSELGEDEYVRVVVIWIKSDHRYLIQKTSEEKGGEYAVTGGHITSGNTSLQQVILEVEEEMGLKLNPEDVKLLGNIYREHLIFDVYYYEDESFKLSEFNFSLKKDEVEDIVWLSKNDIEDLILKGEFRESSATHYFKFIRNE